MKKIMTFLLLVLLVPTMVFADTKSYTSETLEETLSAEDIEANLENYSEEDGKVSVYLFRGQGCSHCHEFLEFVSSDLVEEYGEYFNLVSYEVWNNQTNASLMEDVSDYLGDDANGVPYIIIGDKTFNGYSASMDEEIKAAIKDLYNNEERYDVFEQMKESPKEKKTSKQDNSSTVVLIILASVAIIVLIVTGIKKNS